MYFLSTPSFSLSLSALHPRAQRVLPGGSSPVPGCAAPLKYRSGRGARGGVAVEAHGVRGEGM